MVRAKSMVLPQRCRNQEDAICQVYLAFRFHDVIYSTTKCSLFTRAHNFFDGSRMASTVSKDMAAGSGGAFGGHAMMPL